MKPTKQQIVKAVEEFGMLRYFPADDAARKGVMRLLDRMVGTQEQLAWLVRTMVDQVGEWPGPVELRGVLCAKFQPADGVEANCSAGGVASAFSPDACEGRSFEAHEEHKKLGAGVSAGLLPSLRRIE